MKTWPSAAVIGLCVVAAPAMAREPVPTAVFDLGFDDTSLQGAASGPRSDEQHRLAALNAELAKALVESGCCRLVDLRPVAEQAQRQDLRSCNRCDVDLAGRVGAKRSVIGWVQKVSNLILNINVVVRDVPTGRVIAAGSVDLRGNSDESWSRGLSYLLRNRLRPSDWP